MKKIPICCRYDGTFSGFLTCVFECYVNKEEPVEFCTYEDDHLSLYPERVISFQAEYAQRVYRSLSVKFGPAGQRLVALGFLSCMENRELYLWKFILMGYRQGPAVVCDLTHPVVHRIQKAVRHLEQETHLLKGFIRFSLLDGILVGEIEPKNRVLPLLRPHFCNRYPQETFLLYDRTHQEGLFHEKGRWAILPLNDFRMGLPGQDELQYRQLWRTFYRTISIEARSNPRCRMSHMPKRYWNTMTEFQTENCEDAGESSALPAQTLCSIQSSFSALSTQKTPV